MKLAACATDAGEYLLLQLDSVCIEVMFVASKTEVPRSTAEIDPSGILSGAGISCF
jgi:hypothetical protein